MEILNQIWQTIYPYVAGISVSSIFGAIIYGSLRGAFNKTISRLNVEKISENATEKGIERIKKVSFTHSIQPLVESELKKISEKAEEVSRAELVKMEKKYDNIILVLEKFAAYFDNSIGVSENAKLELRSALNSVKNTPNLVESTFDEEIPVNTVIVEKKPLKTAKNTNVER